MGLPPALLHRTRVVDEAERIEPALDIPAQIEPRLRDPGGSPKKGLLYKREFGTPKPRESP